jgi:NRPS condensation-like uncharacterized protein
MPSVGHASDDRGMREILTLLADRYLAQAEKRTKENEQHC